MRALRHAYFQQLSVSWFLAGKTCWHVDDQRTYIRCVVEVIRISRSHRPQGPWQSKSPGISLEVGVKVAHGTRGDLRWETSGVVWDQLL